MFKPLLYIGGALGLWYGYSYLSRGIKTINTADKLQLAFTDIRNITISGGKLSGSLVFRAVNPTTSPLTISNMLLDVMVTNGPQLANINITTPIIIPSTTAKNIGIPVTTNKLVWQGVEILADLLSQLIDGGKITMPKSATISGTVTANGFTTEYKKIIPMFQKSS